MNTKILASLATIVAVGVIAIGVTYAWDHSVRTSTNNTFASGTLDLSLSSGSGYHADDSVVFGTANNMAPGEDVGSYTLYFQNSGVLAGKVKANIDYVAINPTNTDADLFAQKMIVKSAKVTDEEVADEEVAGYWAQQIIVSKYASIPANAITAGAVVSDGGSGYWPTIYGLKQITLYFWKSASDHTDISFAPGAERHEVLTLAFDKSADENYMGKGINITVKASMNQFNSDEPW
jgi:predicted ribosomally synthesized peptide with SipW-like signal peptide